VLIDGGQFTPVACVDINIEKAQESLSSLHGWSTGSSIL